MHVRTKIRFWRTVHGCCHHPSRCTLISGRIFVEQNVWQNSKMSIEQSTNIIPIIPLISIRKPESEEEEELVVCIIYIYIHVNNKTTVKEDRFLNAYLPFCSFEILSVRWTLQVYIVYSHKCLAITRSMIHIVHWLLPKLYSSRYF